MGMRQFFNSLPPSFKEKVRRYCDRVVYNNERSRKLPHTVYGSIYTPPYNPNVPMNSSQPEFYTKDGRRLDMFFLRDEHFAHCPSFNNSNWADFAQYNAEQNTNSYHYPAFNSKWFAFDLYNLGLKKHFYSHASMLETMGQPDQRYGVFWESEVIVPDDYGLFDRHPGLEQDFDLIFTYSAKLLDKLPNARFVPFAAGLWVGEACGDVLSENAWARKSKNVSMLSSNKVMCDIHKLRLDLALKCKKEGWADTFGNFDGGPYVDKLSRTLDDYRYSIILENDIKPFYFSERFTSCLAAMTVPIYLGASEIDRFFNPDGIIKITVEDFDNIEEILAQCSERDYEERLPAIKDNYERAMRYVNVFDMMYEDYLAPGKKAEASGASELKA